MRDIVYDAIVTGERAKTLARYTDEEYLAGYSALTVTEYGKGRIIVMGFAPTSETVERIVSGACLSAKITPFVKADENITVVKREGDFDAIIAVEHEFMEGELTVPFDAKDLLTDVCYNAGDTVKLKKYGVAVLKKN